jgi:hypothetical protein
MFLQGEYLFGHFQQPRLVKSRSISKEASTRCRKQRYLACRVLSFAAFLRQFQSIAHQTIYYSGKLRAWPKTSVSSSVQILAIWNLLQQTSETLWWKQWDAAWHVLSLGRVPTHCSPNHLLFWKAMRTANDFSIAIDADISNLEFTATNLWNLMTVTRFLDEIENKST